MSKEVQEVYIRTLADDIMDILLWPIFISIKLLFKLVKLSLKLMWRLAKFFGKQFVKLCKWSWFEFRMWRYRRLGLVEIQVDLYPNHKSYSYDMLKKCNTKFKSDLAEKSSTVLVRITNR